MKRYTKPIDTNLEIAPDAATYLMKTSATGTGDDWRKGIGITH